MAIPSFLFGAGTKYKTQEELERAREQVKALLKDTTQYTGWGGVLENLGEGIAAGLEQRRINEGQEIVSADQERLWNSFPGYDGGGSVGDIATAGGSDTAAGGVGTDTLTGKGNGDYRAGIAGIESSGNYRAIGPRHPKMGRALGKYQIMESNIGPWSREALGREVSPEEFLADEGIQDAIFDAKFGSYVKQYGPEGAARAWLGGPGGVNKPGRKDVLGTSVGDYGRRFMNSLGGGGDALAGGAGTDPINQAFTSPPPSSAAPPAPAPVPVRNVPVNDAGLRTPAGADFLSRMGSPAPMSGGPQPPPMIPGMNGPMPMRGVPTTPLPMPPSPRQPTLPVPAPAPPPQQGPTQFDLHDRRRMTPAMTGIGLHPPGESMAATETAPRIAPAPVPPPPQPVPTPPPAPVPTPSPAPVPPPVTKVDPFTDMILGDQASKFKPGNYIPPAPVGQQVFPAAPPAPGTPAAAGFGVPPVVGGGGADQLAGKGTFPPAPAPPQAQGGGGGPQDKISKLMYILASPNATDEMKRMAGAMLQREYALEDQRREAAAAANDPLKKAQLEKAQIEVEQLKNPSPGHRILTPEEVAVIPNADPTKVYQKDLKDGSISVLTGATPEDGGLINLGDGVLYDTKLRKVVYDQSKEGGPKKPDEDAVSSVRKEIRQLPQTEVLAQAAPIYRDMVKAAGRTGKVSDISLVMGLGKILDPKSVVREGEQVVVKNAASLPQWLQGQIDALNGGAELTPDTRLKLLAEAHSRVNSYSDEYKNATEFFRQMATRRGYDPLDLIQDFGTFAPWVPGQSPAVSPSVKKKADKFLGGGG